MEDSVEWCWHRVAVQGKCPFKRPAVKGGVIIEMDQRVVAGPTRSRRRRRRIRSRAEDTTGQRAIHSWVEATGAPFLARELYFPDQLEDSAAK